MNLVLDASMTIAWLFVDENSDGTEAAMSRVEEAGAMVPGLWRLEVANVLRNAVRRRRCDEAYVDRCLARLARLAIRIDDQTDRHAWHATRNLARSENLTLYDAAYLELAIRLQLPLASCDTALLMAAERRNVAILTA